jgi:hypothetical protein
MGYRALLRSIFAEHDLARVILGKWCNNFENRGVALTENYLSAYTVIFQTMLCFSVMRGAIMTHALNGFEIPLEWLKPSQSALLKIVLDARSESKAFCPFVKNLSLTSFKDDEPGADWCCPQQLFALYVEEELMASTSVNDFVVRVDALQFVLQDLLRSQMQYSLDQRQYLQRFSDVLFEFCRESTALRTFRVEKGVLFSKICD